MILERITSFPDVTWILTGIIGILTMLLVKKIVYLRSLPPGPFPLPIVGSLLEFRGKDKYPRAVLKKLSNKYKTMFTLWLGTHPTVFVCDWDLCKEALLVKRNDFSGRTIRRTTAMFLGDHQDVFFGDFGPAWETLRKIILAAVRKYSISDSLPELVSEVVDITADQLIKDGKPFNANDYVYLIVYNIIASSAFGQRYEMDDPEFLQIREINDKINEIVGNLPSDYMPLLKYFYRKEELKFKDLQGQVQAVYRKKLFEHKASYQKGKIRDFTDAVLAAREEAEDEGLDKAEHLSDGNMTLLLQDFFDAGTDTTAMTCTWMLLFACQYQDVQKRIQAEIDENIGSRPPCQNDRMTCPYICSTITEILRYRPVIDSSLEHKTTCDTELGGYKFPKDTNFVFNIRTHQFNETIWENPEKFSPERFLDSNGQLSKARLTGYLPFGLGRRACPGEKLAIADVFLIMTRLFQRFSFELENGPGSASLEPIADGFFNFTEKFNLVIKKRL